MIYFIGGTSGSVMTAVMPHLKQLLADRMSIYDFDVGVPENSGTKWRQEAIEQWLQKLLSAELPDGRNASLLGQIVLGEILACPSATQINEVNF